MNSRFLAKAIELLHELDEKQYDNIQAAAKLISDSFIRGGILQAFGSGHSYAASIEMVERAGGFIATKLIKDPAQGIYEKLEGTGVILMKKSDIRAEDVVVIISYSGRNPLVVEIADYVKSQGAKLIAITSIEAGKNLPSRHSSGKKLIDFADICLDMMGVEGDAAIAVDGLPAKIAPTSSVAAASLIQAMLLEVAEEMLTRGVQPDIRISANLDTGGLERSFELSKKYAHRIFRV